MSDIDEYEQDYDSLWDDDEGFSIADTLIPDDRDSEK
jgi:hypothetical protein